MARSTPPAAVQPKTDSPWTSVFMILAVVALAIAFWYGLQSSEFQYFVFGLVAAGALIVIALRPWRGTSDRGAVALWVVGSFFLLVSLVSDFALAPTVAAGAGGGFVLGLAASRYVFATSGSGPRRAS